MAQQGATSAIGPIGRDCTGSDGYDASSGTYKSDLNVATHGDLLKVEEIGDALAARLLAAQPFKDWAAVEAQVGPERLANLQNAFFISSGPDPKMFRHLGISDIGTSGVRWAAMWGRASNDGEIKLQIRRAETGGDLSDPLPRDVLKLNTRELNWMMSADGREILARCGGDYEDDQWREIQACERREQEKAHRLSMENCLARISPTLAGQFLSPFRTVGSHLARRGLLVWSWLWWGRHRREGCRAMQAMDRQEEIDRPPRISGDNDADTR